MGSATAADDRLPTPRPFSMAPLCTPGNPISSSRRPPRGARGASSDSSGEQDTQWCLDPGGRPAGHRGGHARQPLWRHRSTPGRYRSDASPHPTPGRGAALPGPAPRPAPHPATGSVIARCHRAHRNGLPAAVGHAHITDLGQAGSRPSAMAPCSSTPRRLCVPTPVTQPAQHATDPKPALTRFFESK